jgi:hypothetical protein
MILGEILSEIFFYDFRDTRVKIFFIISGRIKKILCSRQKQDGPGDDPRIWAMLNLILK